MSKISRKYDTSNNDENNSFHPTPYLGGGERRWKFPKLVLLRRGKKGEQHRKNSFKNTWDEFVRGRF